MGNSQLVTDKMSATAEDAKGGDLGVEIQQNQAIKAQHSYVWKYFTEDDISSMVKCWLCKAVLKCNKNTSAMLNHLKMKHLLLTASSTASIKNLFICIL